MRMNVPAGPEQSETVSRLQPVSAVTSETAHGSAAPGFLRLLLIEDSANDAELLVDALLEGGYAPDVTRVESRPALLSALDRRTWDLVLCDYTMPQFSGLEALTLVHSHAPDLPFIFVS